METLSRIAGQGEVCIFNVSYENVLVTKVHPEFILGENSASKKKEISTIIWDNVTRNNRFERTLANGTSSSNSFYTCQKRTEKRFIERMTIPQKLEIFLWRFKRESAWKEYRRL